MSQWRVIITDSESTSGVAPRCPGQLHSPVGLDPWVYDCCTGPHIECGTESAARIVAEILTANDAEVCS